MKKRWSIKRMTKVRVENDNKKKTINKSIIKKNKDRQGKNDTRWCGEDKESNDTHKTINSEN